MKIDLDHVFAHAVPLMTILSITVQWVWNRPHLLLTDHVRTL